MDVDVEVVQRRVLDAWRALPSSPAAAAFPHLATPATTSAAALKAIAQWRRRLVATSGGEPRATALLAHFLQRPGAEVVSVESLFAWLFVDEGPHACLSFLRRGDGDGDGEAHDYDNDSGGEKRAVWLALALPVAWLVKKLKRVAGAPEFVVSEANLVKVCGWVRQADSAGDVEVTVLLARCLGVFFILSSQRAAKAGSNTTARQAVEELLAHNNPPTLIQAGLVVVRKQMEHPKPDSSWVQQVGELFLRHPDIVVRRAAINALAWRDNNSFYYRPVLVSLAHKLTALATGGDHASYAQDQDDPEIMADVLRLAAFSVHDEDQEWARALQQGRCKEVCAMIGRAALRGEHAPLVAAAGMLVDALNMRHDHFLGRELTEILTPIVGMQWHGDGVVGSLLSLTLDCVLAHRDSGEETQESVKALPADLQDSLDNRLLYHQTHRALQMCRLRLGAKCLHWSPATCDSLIWDSVDKWLKPDQPWHLQTRAMLLLHCYESHQMTGRHLTATNHKPDAVATLSLVMELLHSPQWKVRETACRTLAWFRESLVLDAQLLSSFQQQHATGFVAESVKLMQTGSIADPNQIQLQWNCLHVISDLIGSSSSGVEVVFSVVSPRRLLACALSLLNWTLFKDRDEERLGQDPDASEEDTYEVNEEGPPSHSVVADVLHHVNACAPDEVVRVLPQVMPAIITCVVQWPRSPLAKLADELVQQFGTTWWISGCTTWHLPALWGQNELIPSSSH